VGVHVGQQLQPGKKLLPLAQRRPFRPASLISCQRSVSGPTSHSRHAYPNARRK
jgi:hypothetical protein